MPSKTVKILDYRAVSASQRPADPLWYEHGSARAVRDECRFHPVPHAIAERGADGLQSADKGSREALQAFTIYFDGRIPTP